MATARAMLERRRSSRVHIRIPVRVRSPEMNGEARDASAEAISVSRTGALLRLPFLPEIGSRIEVLHGLSQERREFRVIAVRERKDHGSFELGVEILYPGRNFWGISFPDERR
ncbi:MAG TPA: PilZ domain-containing protein [Candidatus Acidoferrales bacterium]|nr:PilZ domain-containing protein [Candidatus Acidoferrales bacterium]